MNTVCGGWRYRVKGVAAREYVLAGERAKWDGREEYGDSDGEGKRPGKRNAGSKTRE